MITEEKNIDLKASTIHLRKDGIMHVHIKDGADMALADAIHVVEAIGILGSGKKFPVMIDCGEFAVVDKEARAFFATKEANIYITADALAYHSFAHKLLADFYVNHNKPQVPTKVFLDNESAIVWLKTFRKT
jgi:hypothetical protein